MHADLAAPFALLALDCDAGRTAIQQDWHGMGQIFHTESEDFVAFSNRPSLLPELLGRRPSPETRGWSLYLGNGQFADDSAPVQDVRLLDPGERITGERVAGQGVALQDGEKAVS